MGSVNKYEDITLRVYDCEELVGVTHSQTLTNFSLDKFFIIKYSLTPKQYYYLYLYHLYSNL